MNKTKFKIALLSALLVSGMAVAQTPADVTAKYTEAAQLYNQKKFAEAIPVLEEAIKLGLDAGPDALETLQNAQKLLPQLYFNNGLKNASMKNFTEAAANLAKAGELGELYGNTSIKNNAATMLGKVYMADGGTAFNNKDYAKAIEVFSKGFAQLPNNTEIGLLLAKSYAESGDMAKASETYKSIIALENTHSKYAEAAAEAKDELATYLLIGATTAAQANNLDEVVTATDAILEFDPTNAAANLLRLQTANNAKNYDAVIGFGEAAAEAQKTDDDKSTAYFFLGAAYQNKDDKAKAIEMYQKVTSGDYATEAKNQIAALSK